jgi:hypothetical protein
MTTTESSAYFDQRMAAIGLTGAEAAAIRAKGWTSLADYAFSSSWTPGQADDGKFLEKVVIPVLGDADHPSASKLRRLLFEAYTMSVGDLRAKLSRTAEDPPLRLSVPERAARMMKLQRRLPGLLIQDHLEPSHKLIDCFVQMSEDDCIHYVAWDELTERNQEVNGISKCTSLVAQVFKPDSNGFLKSSQAPVSEYADLSSDLRLLSALQRRGLAMDMAGLCMYECHQKIVDHFMRELQREPLHDFQKTSLEQVARADRFMFIRIAEMTRTGVKRDSAGDLPVENAMNDVRMDPAFVLLTMQMAMRSSGAGSGGGGSSAAGVDPKTDQAKLDRKRKHEEKLAADQAAKKARLAAKGGGKSSSSTVPGARAKGKGKGPRMPTGLIGMDSSTADGKRLCFGFNLGTCALCAKGAECKNGWHLCCKPGCHKAHSMADH